MTEAIAAGYDARAQGYSIFAQGEDLEDLKSMVKDAVQCHFDEDGYYQANKHNFGTIST